MPGVVAERSERRASGGYSPSLFHESSRLKIVAPISAVLIPMSIDCGKMRSCALKSSFWPKVFSLTKMHNFENKTNYGTLSYENKTGYSRP